LLLNASSDFFFNFNFSGLNIWAEHLFLIRRCALPGYSGPALSPDRMYHPMQLPVADKRDAVRLVVVSRQGSAPKQWLQSTLEAVSHPPSVVGLKALLDMLRRDTPKGLPTKGICTSGLDASAY
jgi:hypothetical protein